MPTELEAKLKIDSHDAVRRALTAAGAQPVTSVLEHNHILDKPDGSFRAQGRALRVRHCTARQGPAPAATLTYKGPTQAARFKSRTELQVEVADADTTLAILQSAGFVVVLLFEKRRETWRLDDCLVELDELPMLGHYVEIEGPTENAIRNAQRQLGLDHLDHIRPGYVTLLAQHCAAHHLTDRHISFE